MAGDKPRRQRASHALAIARWEDNRAAWLDGDFFGLTSRRRDLQDLVGGGGTLWIVVSRRRKDGKRTYSLAFRLDKCRQRTYSRNSGFGRYAIASSAANSTMFAVNDARLLLLGLRFEPARPIDHASNRLKVIGQSIQTPRRLGKADVHLLQEFVSEVDRWSVFISYQRQSDGRLGERLSKDLQAEGVSVFRDLEDLRGGEEWWPTVRRAIARARFFVLVIGKKTHESHWVREEVRHAIRRRVHVVPVLAGGHLEQWAEFELGRRHAIEHAAGRWNETIGNIVAAVRKGVAPP